MNDTYKEDHQRWLREMENCELDRRFTRFSIVYHAAVDTAILLVLSGILLRVSELASR